MGAPATAAVDDGELISRYLAGDEAAAADLVKRHTAALVRFLAVHGAPDDELEDLVQEAFFRAFRGLGRFRGAASFRTWLLTIGSNLIKDRRRRWRGRRVLELTTDVPDPAGGPDGEAEASWAAERLAQGIAHLARLQREVFLLRAQQGLGYEEIARALEISEGAARVHYHHAVKRLKSWIQ